MSTTHSPSTPKWDKSSSVEDNSSFSSLPSQQQEKNNAQSILEQKRAERLQKAHNSDPEQKDKQNHLNDQCSEKLDSSKDIAAINNSISSEPTTEKTEKTSSKKGATYPILLTVCSLAIIALLYLYIEQREQLKVKAPDDYELAQKEYNRVSEAYAQHELANLENEQAKIHLTALETAQKNLASAEQFNQELLDTKEALVNEQERIKTQSLNYYKNIRSKIQRQAKDMFIDTLKTNTGKEFYDVTITKCYDKYISISHANGAARLNINELNDAMKTTLGYINPFDDYKKSNIKSTAQVSNKSKATATTKKNKAVTPDLYEPKSKAPTVMTPTQVNSVGTPTQSSKVDEEGLAPDMGIDIPDSL